MKRAITLILTLAFALSFAACGKRPAENNEESTPVISQTETAPIQDVTVEGDPAEYSMEFWAEKYPGKNICPFYIEEAGTEKPYYLVMEMGSTMEEWINTPFNWNGWHMVGGDIVNKDETLKMTGDWVGEDAASGFSSFCTVTTEPFDASAAGSDTAYVPDAAPETAEQPEAAAPSGWLATRTGRFYSRFTRDAVYMEYEVDMDGTLTTVTHALKNGKTYMDIPVEGDPIVILIDGSTAYFISHSQKMIIKGDAGSVMNMMDVMLDETMVDMNTFTVGTREVDGVVYDTESWIESDGSTTILCFDGDRLVYIIGENGGVFASIKILNISADVDDSLFELPQGYQIIG